MSPSLRPIQLSVLGSDMAVRVPDGRGFAEPVTIKRVRFMDVEVLQTSDIAIDDDSNGVIYVDAVNSVGAFPVPLGSLVSVDGKEERAVIKVTEEVGFGNKVHHWKLEVR